MPTRPGQPQGFSVKLDAEFEAVIKKAAEDERRTIKEVVQEAIRLYVTKKR